jgi:GTP:adenosylcobinamide-phosphate guanylyltransferase
MYQDLRGKLSSGIFAALVYGANLRDGAGDTAATTTRDGNKGNERTPTHLLKRPFEVFDMEGKGYVNEADLERVMTKVTGRSVTASGDERVAP